MFPPLPQRHMHVLGLIPDRRHDESPRFLCIDCQVTVIYLEEFSHHPLVEMGLCYSCHARAVGISVVHQKRRCPSCQSVGWFDSYAKRLVSETGRPGSHTSLPDAEIERWIEEYDDKMNYSNSLVGSDVMVIPVTCTDCGSFFYLEREGGYYGDRSLDGKCFGYECGSGRIRLHRYLNPSRDIPRTFTSEAPILGGDFSVKDGKIEGWRIDGWESVTNTFDAYSVSDYAECLACGKMFWIPKPTIEILRLLKRSDVLLDSIRSRFGDLHLSKQHGSGTVWDAVQKGEDAMSSTLTRNGVLTMFGRILYAEFLSKEVMAKEPWKSRLLDLGEEFKNLQKARRMNSHQQGFVRFTRLILELSNREVGDQFEEEARDNVRTAFGSLISLILEPPTDIHKRSIQFPQ